jgi:hypothetical protein
MSRVEQREWGEVVSGAVQGKLDLSRCNLTLTDIGKIGASMAASITELDCSNNRLNAESTAALVALVIRPHAVMVLDVRDNNLSNGGAVALAAALEPASSTLTSVDLSWNRVGAEGAGVCSMPPATEMWEEAEHDNLGFC